jgi:hypothetical protein
MRGPPLRPLKSDPKPDAVRGERRLAPRQQHTVSRRTARLVLFTN